MNTFRAPNCKLYHVVAQMSKPVSEERRVVRDEIVSPWPLTYKDARFLLQSQLLDSCTDTHIQDVNLQVACPRRPWNDETLQAFINSTSKESATLTEILARPVHTAPARRTDLERLTEINQEAMASYIGA